MTTVRPKIDCCGSNLKTDQISSLGLMTFSIPALFLMIILFPLIQGFALFSQNAKRLKENFLTIFHANIKLIRKQSFFFRTKSIISAKLLNISPALSKVFSKNFNLALLMIPWVLLITGIFIFAYTII